MTPAEIVAAIREHGTVPAAAQALGITHQTLYQRMRRAGVSVGEAKYLAKHGPEAPSVPLPAYLALHAQHQSALAAVAQCEDVIDHLARKLADGHPAEAPREFPAALRQRFEEKRAALLASGAGECVAC